MRLDLFVAMDALAEIIANMAVGYKKRVRDQLHSPNFQKNQIDTNCQLRPVGNGTVIHFSFCSDPCIPFSS